MLEHGKNMKNDDEESVLSRNVSVAEAVRILFWSLLMLAFISAKYWLPEDPTIRGIFIGPNGILLVIWMTAIGWIAWKLEKKITCKADKPGRSG